jgi:hypothetical protein
MLRWPEEKSISQMVSIDVGRGFGGGGRRSKFCSSEEDSGFSVSFMGCAMAGSSCLDSACV